MKILFLILVASEASFIDKLNVDKDLLATKEKSIKFYNRKDLAHEILSLCPVTNCFGVDCVIVTEANGCRTCACPFGSPARGCDRLPYEIWIQFMLNGCPDPDPSKRANEVYPVQKIARWFRHKDPKTGIDECQSYIYPYCYKSDYNLWRSPRTREECLYYCYKPEVTAEVQENVLNSTNVGN